MDSNDPLDELQSGVLTYHATTARVINDLAGAAESDSLRCHVQVFRHGLPVGQMEFPQPLGTTNTALIRMLIVQRRYLSK